jgi:hypothetical protein
VESSRSTQTLSESLDRRKGSLQAAMSGLQLRGMKVDFDVAVSSWQPKFGEPVSRRDETPALNLEDLAEGGPSGAWGRRRPIIPASIG